MRIFFLKNIWFFFGYIAIYMFYFTVLVNLANMPEG